MLGHTNNPHDDEDDDDQDDDLSLLAAKNAGVLVGFSNLTLRRSWRARMS